MPPATLFMSTVTPPRRAAMAATPALPAAAVSPGTSIPLEAFRVEVTWEDMSKGVRTNVRWDAISYAIRRTLEARGRTVGNVRVSTVDIGWDEYDGSSATVRRVIAMTPPEVAEWIEAYDRGEASPIGFLLAVYR